MTAKIVAGAISAIALTSASFMSAVSTSQAAPPATAASSHVQASSVDARLNTPLARNNPQISRALLDSMPSSVLSRGDLYVDPSTAVGTPWFFTNGRIVPGQSATQTRVARQLIAHPASSCRTSVVAPYHKNIYYNSACGGFIGLNSNTTITYHIEDGLETSGYTEANPMGENVKRVCTAVGPQLPKCHMQVYSYYGGFAEFPKDRTMHWGNVAGTPRMGFYSPVPIYGWYGSFSF